MTTNTRQENRLDGYLPNVKFPTFSDCRRNQ